MIGLIVLFNVGSMVYVDNIEMHCEKKRRWLVPFVPQVLCVSSIFTFGVLYLLLW